MNQFLRDNAPVLLLVLASVILAIAFSLPIGTERLAHTQYQLLEGFAGSFEAPKIATVGIETLGLVAQTMLQKYTPIGINAPARTPRVRVRKRAVSVVSSTAAVSSTAIKLHIPPDIPAPETGDSVGEAYESDPAKYSLEASAAQGPISVRLRGLSRSDGRYILKVSVTNRSGDDFFVRELSLRDGSEVIDSKSLVRLFVEPGRTREGFVVFEKPRAGAAVYVALKEDREKGRTVELAVPYPF
jgi:hypothetical protein